MVSISIPVCPGEHFNTSHMILEEYLEECTERMDFDLFYFHFEHLESCFGHSVFLLFDIGICHGLFNELCL